MHASNSSEEIAIENKKKMKQQAHIFSTNMDVRSIK